MKKEDSLLSELTPQQHQAISHILMCRTYTQAAKMAGVDRTTIVKWLKNDPVFQRELGRMRKLVLDQTVNRLARVSMKALKTLEKTLDDEHVPSRVRAAVAILDKAFGVAAMTNLEQELAAIREFMEQEAANTNANAQSNEGTDTPTEQKSFGENWTAGGEQNT